MMRSVALSLAVVLATTLPTGLLAQDARVALSEVDRAAATLSEVQSLETLATSWRESIREPGEMLSALSGKEGLDDPAEAWRRAVDKAFDAKIFASRLARAQAEGLNAKEQREVIAFRTTAIGRGLTVAETSLPLSKEEMADQAKSMAALGKADGELKKDPARRRIVDQLIETSGGVAMQVELMMGLSRGVAIGAALSAPAGQQRPSTDEIAAMVDQGRPAMMALMKGIMPAAMQLTFRKVPTRDLAAYVTFMKTPTGRKNIAIVIRSFATLIAERGVAIGEAFAKELAVKRL